MPPCLSEPESQVEEQHRFAVKVGAHKSQFQRADKTIVTNGTAIPDNKIFRHIDILEVIISGPGI